MMRLVGGEGAAWGLASAGDLGPVGLVVYRVADAGSVGIAD